MMPAARPGPACWARLRRPGQYGKVTDRDLLRDAVAELYGVAPHEFIARRAALATAARGAGDQPAAKQIAALRKPTQSAWIVNQLARSVPSAATQLADLGADLRKAQRTLDGTAIRELSVRRRELIDDLTRQAFAAVGQPVPPAALRDEVTTTLAAVVADPEVAGQFEAGAMARAARSDGFGATGPLLTVVGPSDPAPVRSAPSGSSEGPGRSAGSRSAGSRGETARSASSAPAEVRPLKPASARKSAGKASSAKATSAKAGAASAPAASATSAAPAVTQAKQAKQPKQAKSARPVSAAAAEKERRDRRRRALADAQKAATKADRAADSATKIEQDLERTVLTLEEKLADAREQLNEARLKARRARTNSRQLRQSLDRLRA
jgi:hypothetical protein